MNRTVAAVAAVVGIASVSDLVVALRPEPDPIPADELKAAVDRANEVRSRGELLVHSPLFSMRELRSLDGFKSKPDRPLDDVLATRRVVKIDRLDHPMFGLGGADETFLISDRVMVEVYEPRSDGEAQLFDLLTAFDATTMRVERPIKGRMSACNQARAEGGYACPGQPEWLYIAPRSLVIGGRTRSCLWAHPTTGGAIHHTVPAQPDPAPGRKLELEVSAGLTDDAVRGTPNGAAVDVELRQGGEHRGTLRVANQVGWETKSFDLAPSREADLVITTPRDGRRHFCLNARVVEVAAP